MDANANFQPRTIEESYLEIGYKPVGEALGDFAQNYNRIYSCH